MDDYHIDFKKSKTEIYTELIERFNEYNSDYIKKLIDHLYEREYLIENISVPGWYVFISNEIQLIIKKIIKKDTGLAYQRLLIYKLLDNKVQLDIIRLIIEKYIDN
tara:strand:- start:347 stop:664 length:318 start_codon:yes stop_codon:yes gene_type:complete